MHTLPIFYRSAVSIQINQISGLTQTSILELTTSTLFERFK
jgi:hypothetical protein